MLAPLPPHLVADHDMDRHFGGRVSRPRPLQRVSGRVGALASLPLLALTEAKAQGEHRGDPLGPELRQDGVVVEPPVEEDGMELPSGHLQVVEGSSHGGEGAAVPRVESQGGDEAEARHQDREGGEAVGAMGAPLFLRLHRLASTRILGPSVVRSVMEVDGDIVRLLRDMAADLLSQGERERTLGPPGAEVTTQPPGGAVGEPPSALGTGPMNGGAENGRPQQ